MSLRPAPCTTASYLLAAASYLLAAAAILAALGLHLLHALFAGMLVYMLIHLAHPLVGRLVSALWAKLVATAVLAIVVVAGVSAFGLWVANCLHGGSGIDALWTRIAEAIDGAGGILPAWLFAGLPASGPEVKTEVLRWLHEHVPELRLLGKEAGVAVAHVLIGMVLGAMIAVQELRPADGRKPLAAALMARVHTFYAAFHNVFAAQAKIAAINATLTGLYLLVLLPLAGIHLPFTKTLILITALVGLLPVIGNLISNTLIVLISLSVTPLAALLSLLFLIVLHKGEYFLNARIVGGHIDARAWEILVAMVVMEALFGFGGVAMAPVLYAYIKAELRAVALI
jgi:predicted PurR-regulated permease PerM